MSELFSLLPGADDIEKWARFERSAEHLLAELIQMLIANTAAPRRLDVPVGKAINQPGPDGIVDSDGNAWVPPGHSIWEWGVPDPDTKSNADYRSRTMATDEATLKASTFVFVTPWKWARSREWESAKRDLGEWAEVRVIDSSDLVGWLRTDIASHLWLAEKMNGPFAGEVRTLRSHWQEWADRFWPPEAATPDLVLAGRLAEAEKVRGWIALRGYHFLRAESEAEGAAFVAAALISSEPHASALSQAVVVESHGTWMRLVSIPRRPMILVPLFPGPNLKPAIDNGHTIIVPVAFDQPGAVEVALPFAEEQHLVPAIIGMGVDAERAGRIAKSTRGSMIGLQQGLSSVAGGQVWSAVELQLLAPAGLAGRWDEASVSDSAVLEHLTGGSYSEFAEGLHRLSTRRDQPVRLAGTAWTVSSQLDILRQIARVLSPADWDSFEAEVIEVLGARDPAWDLPAEERWMANIKGKARPHSQGLRNGLAEALAIVATQPEFAGLAGGRTGSDLAARVVGRLLRTANEDPTGERWVDLEDQLPLLAEAAPNVFISETQRALEGDRPVLANVLVEEPGAITPRTHLSGLLWALERLAWSPDYLSAVAVVLARLAMLDPIGQTADRVTTSLAEILLPWHPQTTADANARLDAIKAAGRAAPEVVWTLLIRLLPKGNDIGGMSARPEWRGWAPLEDTNRLPDDYWEVVRGVLDQALADAGVDAPHWKDLVQAYGDLPDELGDLVLNSLSDLDMAAFSNSDLETLSDALQESLSNHRTFADAAWALPAGRVDKLEGVASRFIPPDPVLKHLWLFAQHPGTSRVSGADYSRYDERLAEMRAAAISEVVGDRGWRGIEELVDRAENPYSVGVALIAVDDAMNEDTLSWASRDEPPRVNALAGYLWARNRRDGWAWTDGFIRGLVPDHAPDRIAHLLLSASRMEDAWSLAGELGAEVEAAYWKQFDGQPRDETRWTAVLKLLEFGRPFAAIRVIGMNCSVGRGPFEPDIAYVALDSAARSTAIPPPGDSVTTDHDVAQIVTALDAAGFDAAKLADIEWRYLRILERQPGALRHIHRRIATDPRFFVEVVSLVFRGKGEEPPTEYDPELVRYIEHAFALLRSWHGPIPGQRPDGSVDQDVLNAWVDEARGGLAAAGRAEVGDQHIGQALWYSPAGSDGLHPIEAVRDLLERVASQAIETGFSIEATNSRGAVFRGRGGDQERDLAERYRALATAFAAKWPRTAGVFRGLDEHYMRLANWEDLREEADS